MASPSVAVLGASGYAGAIAAQLLYRHRSFELEHVTARSDAGAFLDNIHPRTRVPLELETFDAKLHGDVDAALVCYPHRVAAPTVAELRARGVRVVDLSADFRLRDRGIYEDWYGEHGAPDLFGSAVYGLPELYREALGGADLVANPGCYPTAALLALAPLAREGLISDVVIDAKSGVSGAGREPTRTTHYIAADENLTPYKVEGHRHTPEIEQELGGAGQRRDRDVRAPPRPARPGRARLLLRHADARPRRRRAGRALRRCVRATSRGSSCGAARPG